MQAILRCRWLLAVLVGITALVVFAATPAFAQSVTTAKSDYHPGNIVSIIGSGWAPGETVTLVISESPANNPDVSLRVTADGSGNFLSEDFTVPDNAAGSNYTVKASNLSGATAQIAFTDSAAGALCAAVNAHGVSQCPLAIGATGVLGVGVTHYKQQAGSPATYQIIVDTAEQAPLVEALNASFCPGGVKVLVKSTPVGNTLLCGTVSGSYIITFSWTAQGPTGGPTCQTTIVAYKTDVTGGGADQFSNTDNDIVADDSDNGLQTASAGIGVVDSSGNVIPDVNGQCVALFDCSQLSCDDGNVCTVDTCTWWGGCQHTPGNAGTVCRASAGVCDVAENCTGTSAACPADGFVAAGTECRASTGQCDVAETCTGTTGACPADSFASATTVCTGTSQGGACDDVDHCSGTANTCLDGFKASTVVCRASAGQCDVAESCTGTSGTCPTDKFASVTTTCTGTSQGGACDGADHCSGTSNTCVDGFLPSTTVCRASAGVCDVAENCTGSSGACPTDAFKSSSTVCRPVAGVCDAAENCTGSSATCPADVFQACASVTDSALCQFDTDTTQCNGTPGGRVFNVLFTPDVQLWPAYKQNASNPGQFYYNLVFQGTEGSTYPLTITIPWPFITVGAVPVHVYDAKDVTIQKGTNGLTCFTPPGTAIATSTQQITLADWANGTNGRQPVLGPNGSGFCTFTVNVTIPANPDGDSTGQVYVNVHLDYGFKGPNVNANPVDTSVDRYDQGAQDTLPNGTAGYDALVNNATSTGALAIDNCTDYKFSHTDGTQPVQSDDVFNLNIFKKISGAFGLVKHSIDGSPGLKGVQTQLINSAKAVVATGTTDQDGFYALVYKHTGKAAQYTVKLGTPYNQSLTVTLKANGWSEADFDIDTGIGFTDTGCGSGATTCQ